MEEEKEFYYDQYERVLSEYKTTYLVRASSKEEADRIIKGATDKYCGVDYEYDRNIDILGGEEVGKVSDYPLDFWVCDDEDSVVISKKMIEEDERKQ